MTNGFNKDNLIVNDVIQERMILVSTHMYKQFLEYQHANSNMIELFEKMMDDMEKTIDYLKQSFTSRGIPSHNIFCKRDNLNHLATLTILWHTISFVTNIKDKPKALFREGDTPLFTSRIMAVKGDYHDILQSGIEDTMPKLLDSEIASLYVPAEKTKSAIIKIKHLGNKENYINQMDAPREFLIRVIETVCGGGLYHEESTKKIISF